MAAAYFQKPALVESTSHIGARLCFFAQAQDLAFLKTGAACCAATREGCDKFLRLAELGRSGAAHLPIEKFKPIE